MNVTVDEAAVASVELLDGLNALIPQLSRSARQMDMKQLEEIVAGNATHLLIARSVEVDPDESTGSDTGSIVGSLTLVVFHIPTGVRAWIEDVVVDESFRGARIGELLVTKALALAVSSGARTVDLTSRPSREAAHRLYSRAGFAIRETAVYRWTGSGGQEAGPA